jgi:hypothetical protein
MKGTGNAPFEADLRFATVDGGTRVDATIEMFMKGPAKLFGPMFVRWYDKNWSQGMVNLKRMMEAGEL